MNEKNDRASLGQRLKDVREYCGYSQEEVAKYLDIPRSAISLIETGDRRLDALELKKLAKLFQCKIEELTDESGTEYNTPESIQMVARAASVLSQKDQKEVLRFAEFLKSRKRDKK